MFKNRKEGGLGLAEALYPYREQTPLVLAIPRGGVEVGYYVAEQLGCALSVIISRKLVYPGQPEAAFGALAEDGSLYLDPWSQGMLTKKIIEKVIKKTETEIARRVDLYRKGRTLPPLHNRTVILVDDGIATGSTMFAAIELCNKRKAARIVAAAPVSSEATAHRLRQRVDEVVILETPSSFVAVSQGYEEFRNLTDDEVLNFLDNPPKRTKAEKTLQS